ncbi:MAG: glycogen synthase [Frankiaceae bacterium]|nr:glycogen synthase [Frankiaceae bacterium]
MRICFVSRRYWPAVSGMSVYAENLLRELVALGHDVTLVAQYRDDPVGRGVYGGGPPPAERVPAGVTVVGVESVGETSTVDGKSAADFEADVARLVEVVEELSNPARGGAPFDILHAQYGYPPGLAVLEASRRLGVPNVVSIQGGDGHWVGTCCTTHKIAITTVLDSAQAVLIGSESFAGEVIDLHGTDRGRFTVIGGATDCERFTPAAVAPAELPPPPELPTLVYHGRVDRRKGVLDLLDALPLLRTPVRLIVSGIGPDLDEVRRRVDAMPVGLVELTGYAAYDDAPAVYQRGTIFVSPTYSEGFSNTVLEAMACGLPVVSTAVVGVVDCLRDGENGLLVELSGYAAYDDAPAVYQRGTIFVSPTYSEGFSNTVLEAMACGLPVVAAETGALADAVADGVTGVLVPPRSPSRLGDAIRSLLSDGLARESFGLAANDRARVRFALDVVADTMSRLLGELTVDKRAVRAS